MTKRSLSRLFAVLLAFAMFAAACGGGDDGGSEEATEAETEEEAETETEEDDSEAIEAGEEAEGDVDTEVEEATGERQPGGTIAVGLEAEAEGLRPWEDTASSPVYNMMISVFDKLMEQQLDGSYDGWLATDISSNEDFTVWTLNLREGVTFHNGVELTAQTIADMFPIQQAGSQSSSQIAASNLSTVEATGDLEVTYTLTQSNSAFPAFLARAQLGFVFEPAAAAADLDGAANNPVGTGPFAFVSRDLDNETVFARNADYWGTDAEGNQLPFLDQISFRPIPDEGTRLDALLSGTVQAIQTLRQGTIRDARAAVDEGAEITLNEFQGNNVGGGMFNVLVPPFDDIRVRRGLTQMNSQEQVIEALGGTGISLPGTQWYSPDSVWYSEAVAAAYPAFDFEAGVETLQGYIDDPERSDGLAPGTPIEVELSCPPDPTLIAAMQVLEQTWSGSGLANVNLTNFDQQTHIGIALGSEEDGFVGTHGAHCWRFSDDNDPSTTINPAVAPPTAEIAEAAGVPGVVSPLNFANWFNGEAFGAAVGATQTDNFEERYALYESIQLAIAEELPIWYSGHTATMIATESNLSGINGWTLPSGEVGIGFPNAEGRWAEVWLG